MQLFQSTVNFHHISAVAADLLLIGKAVIVTNPHFKFAVAAIIQHPAEDLCSKFQVCFRLQQLFMVTKQVSVPAGVDLHNPHINTVTVKKLPLKLLPCLLYR